MATATKNDWDVAGDLVFWNTTHKRGTFDWERAQKAVLAGIQYGREIAAKERAERTPAGAFSCPYCDEPVEASGGAAT